MEVRWGRALIQLRGLDCGAISGFAQERTVESPAPFFSVANYRFADPAVPAPFEFLGTLPYLILNRDALSWIGKHPDR